MTDFPAPLLDLFDELRERNFSLGTSDYVAALLALAQAPGVTSRADLIFMCQLLWAKSQEEQKQLEEVLGTLLPRQLTDDELEELLSLEGPPGAPQPPSPAAEEAGADEGESVAERPPPDAVPPGEASAANAPQPAPAGQRPFTFSLEEGGVPLEVPVTRRPWHTSLHLDFVGSLPITRRQMKRAWRYYRRMRRVGPPAELDVEATVEDIYRRGVFIRPVLIPRRLNQARMLILVDEGGSMVPFRRVTRALLESATHGGLARTSVFFFHDVPGQHLFNQPWMEDSVQAEQVLNYFTDAGVLIISDGGAARGNLDQRRAALTTEFLQLVRRYSPNVAWLNPTPEERWAGTTAAAIIADGAVPMFELTRAGLDAAVDVMRGRVR